MSSYLEALRARDFRLMFFGQWASNLGDQVVLVALALFITRRTGSATDLGEVLGAQSLALVAFLLFGGVWADRLPRHRIMIVCDVVRAGLHAVLAALIFTGSVRIWQMVVIEALFGIARAFFQPAYTGLIPQTVGEDRIQDARALSQSAQNVALLVGPALATALVLGVGAGYAFALDALTFVVSALLLAPVRPRPRGAVAPAASVLQDLRLGWREVASRSWVWVTIAVYAGALMLALAFWNTLAPLIARDHYGGTELFGILVSVGGAGAVVAAMISIAWRPARPLRAGLLLSLFWPLPGIELALGAPIALLVVTAFLQGIGFALLIVFWETSLATHIPPHALSRVSSYDWMGSLVLLPVGQVAAGPLATVFGARAVLGVGSAVAVGLLCLALVPRASRELGRSPRPAPDAGPDPAPDAGPEPPERPRQPSSSPASQA